MKNEQIKKDFGVITNSDCDYFFESCACEHDKRLNNQIKKDFLEFLETGCDYSNEMFKRDQAQIRRGEWLAALCFFSSGLLAGFVLANLAGAV